MNKYVKFVVQFIQVFKDICRCSEKSRILFAKGSLLFGNNSLLYFYIKKLYSHQQVFEHSSNLEAHIKNIPI